MGYIAHPARIQSEVAERALVPGFSDVKGCCRRLPHEKGRIRPGGMNPEAPADALGVFVLMVTDLRPGSSRRGIR